MASVANDRPLPVVRFLLDHGADVDATNDDDTTALHFAASYASDPAVVSLIFEASEEPCTVDKSGRTAQQLLMLDTSPLRHDKALARRFHETCIEAAK
jgi:ankyrin repeat protein